MDVPWVKAYLNYSLPLYPGSPGYEGGLGSWGEGSGHYDSLGWGSLLHHLDDEDVAAAKSGSATAVSSSISSVPASSVPSVSTSSVDSIVLSSQTAFTSASAYSNSTAAYSISATFAVAAVLTTLQTIPIYTTRTTVQPEPTHAFKSPVIVYADECTNEE